MKKLFLIFPVVIAVFSSCVMNVHSADRAVMLEENEAEFMAYTTGNFGGGIGTEFNIGGGLGARLGMSDNFTFGTSADFNFNSVNTSLVDNIFYGQVSLDQKFSVVKDIFAVKIKEGIFINNYFGTVEQNATTGLYEFVSREKIIPFISPSLLFSPEGRLTKKWQLTIGLNSIIGLRYGRTPWTIGGTLLFDYAEKKDKFLTGFELGTGMQTLVNDGEVFYLSLGFFFSKFKKTTPRPPVN